MNLVCATCRSMSVFVVLCFVLLEFEKSLLVLDFLGNQAHILLEDDRARVYLASIKERNNFFLFL